MKSLSIIYKGYLIEITQNLKDFKYYFSVKNDFKTLIENPEGYTFPDDAEVNAKMYINHITSKIK